MTSNPVVFCPLNSVSALSPTLCAHSVSTDLLNFGAEWQMHCAFVAVHEFLRANGRMPAPNNEAETAQV